MKRQDVIHGGLPTLSVEQLNKLLEKVTYKPSWEFMVYQGRHEGTHMLIEFEVEDSYNPGTKIKLDANTFVPPMNSIQQFYDWLLDRIKRMEVHEAREFFKIAGDVWDDPHAEFADRDL